VEISISSAYSAGSSAPTHITSSSPARSVGVAGGVVRSGSKAELAASSGAG
jgi:hypothetical protein